MDFLELAKKRYSCRKYLAKQVEPEKLNVILEAGRVAPTGANKQPQRLIVIQSDEGRRKVNRTANTFDAPLVIIVCSDSKAAWQRSFDNKKITDIDAAIVTDHMMLATTDLGLDSVWICHFDPEVLRDEFEIPEHLEPVNILAVGYRDGQAAPADRHNQTRLPIDKTVFFERF